MRRFLVVGCGGSGGGTLAYLMDQLRSELAAYGVDTLPGGWRFVHVDVPATSQKGPDGVSNVQRQGGTYIGTGAQGLSYQVLDNSMSNQFKGQERLDCIGTWAPREPKKVIVPLSEGAGQYRAVGRMVTLRRAVELRAALNREMVALGTEATLQEMRAVAQRVPGLRTADDEKNSPIVLVVSSMAGGAGASMALDVCRVLSLVNGVTPALTGMFLVAPNIFDDALPASGRTGVRPNALAMLGEIVAAQTGSAAGADMDVLQALG